MFGKKPLTTAQVLLMRAQAEAYLAKRGPRDLDPLLLQAIEEEIVSWQDSFGEDGRIPGYAAALAIFDGTLGGAPFGLPLELEFEAEVFLERAADPNWPPDPEAWTSESMDVLRGVRAAMDPGVDTSDPVALRNRVWEMQRAFLLTSGRERLSGDKSAGEALDAGMRKEIETIIASHVKRGARFERERSDIADRLFALTKSLPAGYRPQGRGGFPWWFLRDYLSLRLDDEKRLVGDIAVRRAWFRDQVRRGRISRQEPLTPDVVLALREQATARSNHAVPAGFINSKSFREILLDRQEVDALRAEFLRDNPDADLQALLAQAEAKEGWALPPGMPLGQRSIDKLVTQYEQHRGTPFGIVGRSKCIPVGEVERIVAFWQKKSSPAPGLAHPSP